MNLRISRRFSPLGVNWVYAILLLISPGCLNAAPLIPENVPAMDWVQFPSPARSAPVSGMIFDDQHPTCCGLALGGISTGCLDLDVDGTIGFDTIFQGYPKKLQRKAPFLGIAVGNKTWVLTTPSIIRGGMAEGCFEPGRDPYTGPRKWNVAVPAIQGVDGASSIRYFAHYPVVDYQYKIDAPVAVGLRAWSPFIPGDVADSSIPAIVFEVQLENMSSEAQQGTVALNYPGEQLADAKNTRWADSGQKGDVLLKSGTSPFDGKTLPETQLQFSRPNPGTVSGGKMVIGDPSGDGRREVLVGLRDGKTGRGFLVSIQRTADGFGKRMDGTGKYEYEIIDTIADDGFSAIAVGDLSGDGLQEIVAGTETGRLYSYRRKTVGYSAGSAKPLALYDRKELNPSQKDGGHISEIRIGRFYGGRNEIVYSVGYKSANSQTKPGAYLVDDNTVFEISTDFESEYLGCAAGNFLGNGTTEIAIASKSSVANKNWVKIFQLGARGEIKTQETVIHLGANEGPQWLVSGDFNGDGTNDLLIGTLKRGTLWVQHNNSPISEENAWSESEVASSDDYVAYSDPTQGYKNDPKTYIAVGGQNTVILGRRDGPDIPPGRGVWGNERYYLGPHQGLNDAALPAVAMGNLSSDGALDVLTWNSQGELTGLTYEGGKFFDVKRPQALQRKNTTRPQATTVSLPFNEQYAISLLDGQQGRFGGDLAKTPRGWSEIRKLLPAADTNDTGASAAIDFSLAPGEKRVLRFALTWYVPQWRSAFTYTRMNLIRYRNVSDIADFIDRNHSELFSRICAWQGVIDSEKSYPIWLKEALINSLALITVDSYWGVSQPPLGDWCFPNGLYAMIESPRAAPQTECIPCTWYGNIPVVYFFPDLMHTTLRGFKEYQRTNDGAMAFNFAPRDELWWMGDHALENQIALNGFCFVDLVNRQWLRTGDDSIVHEFYPAVKAATQFASNTRPKEYGLMHMPHFGSATEWWEGWQWEGLTTHAGSLNLAGALIAKQMAIKEGDDRFAGQCDEWISKGKEVLEKEMWNGKTYLLFKNPETRRTADDIMANQFDAEWVASYGGVSRIFDADHFRTGMATVRNSCIVDTGLAAFASKDGKPYLKAYGNFTPEAFILGMTYMYAGDKETGLKICQRTLDNIYKKQRYAFDWPNQIDCESGKRTYGTDYYQNMVVWAIPAALEQQSLAQAVAKGSIIDRIIEAGSQPPRINKNLERVKPAGTHDNLVPNYVPPTTGEVKPLQRTTN